jgi:hypothetical protein
MAAWMQAGLRLDIAIAVALEVAVLDMKRAENAAQSAAALDFNSRLWRAVACLASTAPLAEDRDGLADAAALVAGGRMNIDDQIALDTGFARTLAGRAATGGALRQILAEWRGARASTDTEFGPWLVARLEGLAPPQCLAA